jgi:MFS family permease
VPDEVVDGIEESENSLPPHIVNRAVKLSYAQAMLGSIYAASTGGMFLIGYALTLGANNVQIGLMSTIPMLFVVVQLISSTLIERGASRRRMTLFAAALNVSGWVFIIALPRATAKASPDFRIAMLIAIMAVVTMFAYVSGNARSSWVGDLVPPRTRGLFFGRMMMFAGIIGAVFAIFEGMLLDRIKLMGLTAFNWLFAFGIFFGLLNAMLFIPQADIPVARSETSGRFVRLVRDTFTNKALLIVMAYALIWSFQGIAAPFYATYMLRDLKMPFLGLGILTSISTITMLVSSPFWGRIVDRYGCRPVLIACTSVLIPVPLAWIWMDSARAVYFIAPPLNLLGGFAIAGFSVGLSTLLYKVTPSAGRSMQFAVYSVTILLLVSPMPTIGGHLPGWLRALGIHADLRSTFYTSVLFIGGAAWMAKYIREPDSRRTGELVNRLGSHLLKPSTLKTSD